MDIKSTTRSSIFIYCVGVVIVAFVFYITMKPLIQLSTHVLIFDSFVLALQLGVLSFLLNKIIQYASFKKLPQNQRIINLLALAALFVLLWIGADYILLWAVLDKNDLDIVTHTFPIRIFIALLIYIILVIFFEFYFDFSLVEDDPLEEPEILLKDDSDEELEELDRIVVKNGQKIDIIAIDEVIYLQAEGDYVMIYSSKGKFLKEQTMKYFEKNLPLNKFIRVHRSSIINIDHILSIELYGKQSQVLKLKNGLSVKMSMSGYKLLKSALNI